MAQAAVPSRAAWPLAALCLLCTALLAGEAEAAPAPSLPKLPVAAPAATSSSLALSGKLVKFHSDGKRGAANSWALRVSATRVVGLDLSGVKARPPPAFVPGNKVVVFGRYVALSRFLVTGFGPIKPLVGTAAGTQKAVLFLMRICGKVATVGGTSRAATSADLMRAMFEGPASVASTWRRCSFDLLKLDQPGSIVFPVDVGCARGSVASSCEDGDGGNMAYYTALAARTADRELRRQGISVSDDFDYQMYFFPATKCPWSGAALMSDISSQYSGTAGLGPATMMHELGHNLGLDHSSADVSEYGDWSSAMGNPDSAGMCYALPQQAWLGWHSPLPVDSSRLTAAGGLLTVSINDTGSSPTGGYRIDPDWLPEFAGQYLYISYFLPNATLVAPASRGRLHIHQFSDGEDDLRSYLVARLSPTQGFSALDLDWYDGDDLVVTFLSQAAAGATLTVCLKGRGQCCGVCPPPPPPPKCVTQRDKFYWGGDVASLTVASSGACCKACIARQECEAWSYFPPDSKYPNRCMLKKAGWQDGTYRGVVSGVLAPSSG